MQLCARIKAMSASAKTARLLRTLFASFSLILIVNDAYAACYTLGCILCGPVITILIEILNGVTILSIAAIGGAAIMGKVDMQQAVIVCVGAGIALIGIHGGYFLTVLSALTGGGIHGC
jgi:hypothetical protein